MISKVLRWLRWLVGAPPPKPVAVAPQVDCDFFSGLIARIEQNDASWFVTGVAGTGKSTFLRCLVKKSARRIVVLAPTGLAALNVSGQTIHSFFKLKPDLLSDEDVPFSPLRAHLFRAIDMLVIDEVSMVRADLMNAVDASMRRHRESTAPFGGCQVVLIGDLYQLPPVVPKHVARYLDETYGGPYHFNAPGVRRLQLKCHELTHVFRQSDQDFVELLNRVRIGAPTDSDLIRLNGRHISLAGAPPDGTSILTTTNAVASRMNRLALDQLPGSAAVHEAQLSGSIQKQYDNLLIKHQGNPDQLDQALESAFPAPVRLMIKPGARVIMVKNDTRRRWVNGTAAIVVASGVMGVSIKIGEQTHLIERETWERVEYDFANGSFVRRIAGAFAQYPLRLAWALTIHKSQGQSLDRSSVDLSGGAFAPGQTYVALSRCRSFEGLFLQSPLEATDVFADSHIRDYYASLEHG